MLWLQDGIFTYTFRYGDYVNPNLCIMINHSCLWMADKQKNESKGYFMQWAEAVIWLSQESWASDIGPALAPVDDSAKRGG